MNTARLPASYVPVRKIDLQKNIRQAILVNAGCLVLLILMILIGCLFHPAGMIFSSPALLLYNALIMSLGLAVYMLLHEWTHGFFMKKFSGVKPKYGFTGLYAYAKCDAFFDRKSYLIIGLSPIVLWGAVLSVICCLVPPQLFWGVYLIQAFNIAGAAGDLYTTVILCRMPKEVLVYDFGASMFFYLPVDKKGTAV